MEDNKTICGCKSKKSEKKEYCIIFVIGEKEERHVVITARDVLEAMDTFAHIGRVLFALCSNPNSSHIPNPADVRIIRVFENEA